MDTFTAAGADWEEALDEGVCAIDREVVEIRRRLHREPEPSGEEFGSVETLRARFQAAELNCRVVPARNGLLVDGPAAEGVSRIAFRADLDALRLHDGKSVTYRSQRDGVMHACGHDAHTAIAAGVSLLLQRLEQKGALPWPVPWRAIFQPSEETATGAVQMIEQGALEDVSAVFALHVDPSRRVGTAGVRDGALTASCDELLIRATGRGGHAARPHESQDPIAASAQLLTAIYSLIPRSVDSQNPIVVTIGRIQGGYNANVIPEKVEMEGTLRTLDSKVREATREKLRRLTRGISEASDVTLEIFFDQGLGAVINDPGANAFLREAAQRTLGPRNVEEVPRPSMGGEDFAAYLEKIPGAMFRLGVASGDAPAPPLHSPLFDIDERALGYGMRIIARAVILAARPRPE
jgi:amidohydrolase